MAESMLGEQTGQLTTHRLPYALMIGAGCGTQSHEQTRRSALHHLRQPYARNVIHLECQRRNRNSLAALRCAHPGQEVIHSAEEPAHERRMLIVDGSRIVGAIFVGPPGVGKFIGTIIQSNPDITPVIADLRRGNWEALGRLATGEAAANADGRSGSSCEKLASNIRFPLAPDFVAKVGEEQLESKIAQQSDRDASPLPSSASRWGQTGSSSFARLLPESN
jgi:hypothetical protein